MHDTVTRATDFIVVADRHPAGGIVQVRGEICGSITSLKAGTSLLHMGTVILPTGERLEADALMNFPKYTSVERMEVELSGKVWTGPEIV